MPCTAASGVVAEIRRFAHVEIQRLRRLDEPQRALGHFLRRAHLAARQIACADGVSIVRDGNKSASSGSFSQASAGTCATARASTAFSSTFAPHVTSAGQRILGFVVREAVDARDEHHRRRHMAGQMDRVVSRAAHDPLVRVAELRHGFLDERDALRIERRRGTRPIRIDGDFETARSRELARTLRARRAPSRRFARRRDDAGRP